MIVAVASLVAVGIALPHLLRLDRVAPAVAVSLWLAGLALRALTGFFIVYFVVFYVPRLSRSS